MPETDQNLEEQGYYEKETSSSYTGWMYDYDNSLHKRSAADTGINGGSRRDIL